MGRFFPVYIAGVMCGFGFAMILGINGVSRAADTPTPSLQKAIHTVACHTGIVSNGEQVPIPSDADTGTVQIHLSIREIQDNNEILGRLECYLEPDGMTARVRNVNKFTGEIVATGTANYVVFYKP